MFRCFDDGIVQLLEEDDGKGFTSIARDVLKMMENLSWHFDEQKGEYLHVALFYGARMDL